MDNKDKLAQMDPINDSLLHEVGGGNAATWSNPQCWKNMAAGAAVTGGVGAAVGAFEGPPGALAGGAMGAFMGGAATYLSCVLSYATVGAGPRSRDR